jgi:hypothetical protein
MRCNETAIVRKAERQGIEDSTADRIHNQGRDTPECEQHHDLAQAHQLERVEPDVDRQEQKHGDQGETPMGDLCNHDDT